MTDSTRPVLIGYQRAIGLIGIGRSTSNAETADRLSTPREIALAGDAMGKTMFDGSADVEIMTTVQALTNMEIEWLLDDD